MKDLKGEDLYPAKEKHKLRGVPRLTRPRNVAKIEEATRNINAYILPSWVMSQALPSDE